MATQTPIISLNKPSGGEDISIALLNDSMDKIDLTAKSAVVTTGGITAYGAFIVSSATISYNKYCVSIDVRFSSPNPISSGGGNGNITNIRFALLNTVSLRPKLNVALTGGTIGVVTSGYIDTDGGIVLAAIPNGMEIPANYALSMGGSWAI